MCKPACTRHDSPPCLPLARGDSLTALLLLAATTPPQESPFIAFACDVVSAVRSNNWHRYFTLLRTAPPLLAVVTAKHAPMMRVQALASMLRAAGVAQKRVPLEYFMRVGGWRLGCVGGVPGVCGWVVPGVCGWVWRTEGGGGAHGAGMG